MSAFLAASRQTLRTLWRAPAFTLIAVLTLALGIGANSAIFSALDAVLLRSLPYPEADRLVMLWVDATRREMPRTEWTNRADFADWQAGLGSIESATAFMGWAPTVTDGGAAEQVPGALVSHDAFGVLGVPPLLGRAFRAEEDVAGGPAVVVVSHEFWQRRLGGEPDLQRLRVPLDGVPHAVVGVMPPQFRFPVLADRSIYRPLRNNCEGRGDFCLRAFARLKPGVTLAAAQAEFDGLAQRLAAAYPADNADLGGYVQPLREALAGPVRTQLLVLAAATLLVLLIACANLANLLLARASARGRELAVRSALGAGRARLVRQLLGEGLLLSLLGAGAGLLLAVAATRWLTTIMPPNLLAIAPLAVDLRVVGFSFACATLAALVFASAPALVAARQAGATGLRSGDRAGAGGPGARRLRNALVVGNFALALALCAGAGLFLKSLERLGGVDLGFHTERVLTFGLNLGAARYDEDAAVRAFHDGLLERLRALPGVTDVALTSTLPLQGDGTDTNFVVEGGAEQDPAQQARAWYSIVSDEYFRTLGIGVRGRVFHAADHADAPLALIVNRALARAYFGNADPIGRRLGTGPAERRNWWTVVGVADDVRFFGIEVPQTPAAYLSLRQRPAGAVRVVVRGGAEPLALLPAVRREISALDPSLAVAGVTTMETLVANALRGPRLLATLVGVFALLALLLAAVGVYGVIAYAVSQRTREFGVRMALGARAGTLLGEVMAGALRLTLAGIALGAVLALLLGRGIAELLYEVRSWDPLVFGAVAATLAAVAVLAAFAPALRASRVDPMVALRDE